MRMRSCWEIFLFAADNRPRPGITTIIFLDVLEIFVFSHGVLETLDASRVFLRGKQLNKQKSRMTCLRIVVGCLEGHQALGHKTSLSRRTL